jgi:hypothetical protein
MNISTPIRARITIIRDELRERREARAQYRALRQELAGFRTPREVDELLAALEQQDGPEAEQIRDILLQNLRPTTMLYRAA